MKTILIGAGGKQGREYLPILDACSELVALVDINSDHLKKLDKKYESISFNNLDTVLEKITFDTAVIAVPHGSHYAITKKLIHHKKNVIKEKPFALSSIEADFYINKMENKNSVFTITQRSANPLFLKAKFLINEIKPYAFHYRYFLNKTEMTSGWRSEKEKAIGGVGLDMGYHVVDVINAYFGMPDKINAQFAFCFDQMAKESLEDYLSFQVTYEEKNIVGQASLARHNFYKEECLEVLGSAGSLRLTPTSLELYDFVGNKVEEEKILSINNQIVENLFSDFLKNINNRDYVNNHMSHHFNNVCFMESLYKQMHSSENMVVENL